MQTSKTGLLALYFNPLERGFLEKTEDDSKGLLKIPQSFIILLYLLSPNSKNM